MVIPRGCHAITPRNRTERPVPEVLMQIEVVHRDQSYGSLAAMSPVAADAANAQYWRQQARNALN